MIAPRCCGRPARHRVPADAAPRKTMAPSTPRAALLTKCARSAENVERVVAKLNELNRLRPVKAKLTHRPDAMSPVVVSRAAVADITRSACCVLCKTELPDRRPAGRWQYRSAARVAAPEPRLS